MLRIARRFVAPSRRPDGWRCRHYSASKASDPLRILFCGSDEFSCASLEALHSEHLQNPSLVRSIDVVVRPGKRTGRGLKEIRQVPISALANDLGLRIHERDTFTGWNMPEDINLIIAVSFGLFVPPRLLKAAKYGGLNVHPSMLPDLRGPAPLQHTLLQRRTHAGITVQTLDATAFDHGRILAQTAWPGVEIPRSVYEVKSRAASPSPSSPTPSPYGILRDLLARPAAEMLVSALRSGAHVPPLVDVDVGRTPQLASEPVILHHAPKLTPHDLQIPWFPSDDPTSSLSPPKVQWWSAADLSWRRAVLAQPLWSHALEAKMPRTERRLLFEDVETVAPDALPESVVAWLKRARSRRLQPHLKEEAATHSIATPRPAVESTANGGGAAETDEDGVMVRWVTWLYMPRPPPKSRSPPASAASGVVGSDSTHGTASDSDTDRVDTIANSTSDPQSPIVKQLSSPLAGPGRFHVLHAPYIRHPSLPSGSILLAHPSLDPGEPCLLVHTLRVAGDPGPPRPAATVLEKRFAERR